MSENKSVFSTVWRALPFVGAARPRVSVLELEGVIGSATGPGRKGLTIARLEKAIAAAFKPSRLAAVALAINSPGGSPVQSRLILSEIRRLAAKKKVPVIAFIEDVGASGGYILAIAADEIYADESSIVGSIGVISAGFGFHEAINRIGVERRVLTAGENKSTLDPFKPEDPEEVARLKAILDELHEQFINLVKLRRPGKLSDDPSIFSGAFWAAPQAQKLGLIDGTAQLGDFLRARYGKDVKISRVSPQSDSLLKRLFSGGAGVDAGRLEGALSGRGLVDVDEAIDALEARALWSRYGR